METGGGRGGPERKRRHRCRHTPPVNIECTYTYPSIYMHRISIHSLQANTTGALSTVSTGGVRVSVWYYTHIGRKAGRQSKAGESSQGGTSSAWGHVREADALTATAAMYLIQVRLCLLRTIPSRHWLDNALGGDPCLQSPRT
jgi:hypothetical protein